MNKYLERPPITIAEIKNDYMLIEEVTNPNVEMQLAAINVSRGFAIHYIESPCHEAQMAAVKYNGKLIRHLVNPSYDIQEAAVLECRYAIGYIPNPSKELQLLAIRQLIETHYAFKDNYQKFTDILNFAEQLPKEKQEAFAVIKEVIQFIADKKELNGLLHCFKLLLPTQVWEGTK